LRLKPTTFVVVCVQVAAPPVVQGGRSVPLIPRPFRFRVPATKQQLSVDFRPGDLIDKVISGVAERLRAKRQFITLWFNNHFLDDTIAIDMIGLGPSDEIEVHIQPEDIGGALEELNRSFSGESTDGQAEQKVYSTIKHSELASIRQVLRASRIMRPEIEVIAWFLKCGRSFDKLRLSLLIDRK
jgi:hypothetical protein